MSVNRLPFRRCAALVAVVFLLSFPVSSQSSGAGRGSDSSSPGASIENPGASIDIPRARLDIRGANFRGADMKGANFADADVRGALFLGANVRGASFWRTRLDGADLRGIAGLTRQQLSAATWSPDDPPGW